MKSVYIVTPQLFDGGTASVSSNYYKMFKNLGYNVGFYLLDDLPVSDNFNIPRSSINFLGLLSSNSSNGTFWSLKGFFNFFRKLKNATNVLSKLEGDIVFVHFTPILLGMIANLFFKRKFKFIYTVHTNIYSYGKQLGFLKSKVFNFFVYGLRFADELIFLTKDVSDEYMLRLNGYDCSVSFIPNVYDPFNKDLVSIDSLESFRINSGLGHSSFVLYSGRLSYEKNIDFIIRFYKIYRDNGGVKQLLIAGDGPEKSSLIRLVDDLGISKNVIFLGHVSNMQFVYAISDTLILASNHEGFGMVLLEAIDFHLNLLSSNCPSGPSTIFDQSFDIPLNSYFKNDLGFLLPTPTDNLTDYSDALLLLDKSVKLSPEVSSSILRAFSINTISFHWYKIFCK
ncbi:glycosyltransferase [Shewanella colwelliana]|uniref:glycosyltransferase n=1 Tax=Shewanella colwelliana TaxID=23 RepID=UPI003D0176C7